MSVVVEFVLEYMRNAKCKQIANYSALIINLRSNIVYVRCLSPANRSLSAARRPTLHLKGLDIFMLSRGINKGFRGINDIGLLYNDTISSKILLCFECEVLQTEIDTVCIYPSIYGVLGTLTFSIIMHTFIQQSENC